MSVPCGSRKSLKLPDLNRGLPGSGHFGKGPALADCRFEIHGVGLVLPLHMRCSASREELRCSPGEVPRRLA